MVDLVHAGRTPCELARQFGVAERSIDRWVAREVAALGRMYGADAMPPRILHAELARLREENRQLQRESELLAKTTAWFRKLPVNVDI